MNTTPKDNWDGIITVYDVTGDYSVPLEAYLGEQKLFYTYACKAGIER